MELPKLPDGLVWRPLDGGMSIRIGNEDGEEIAWYWEPEYGLQTFGRNTYDCVSAPTGVLKAENYHRQQAQTEEEAINLIVSFALLGITKEN